MYRIVLNAVALLVTATTVVPAQARPILRVRLAEPITIDGRLDEPDWNAADSIPGFTQIEPVEGVAPRARTTMRVLAAARWIAIGIVAETGGEPITAFAKSRDASLDDEDHIRIAIDPFGDARSGYIFAINPNGARYDALINNQGEGENSNWDAIWEAAVSRTDSSWSVEIRIPAGSLSFPADADQWAFNVQRRRQASLGVDRWAAPERDVRLGQTGRAGLLTGLPRFDLGRGLTVRPSVTAGAGHAMPGVALSSELDASLDIEKRLGANLLGTLTINTDFAETEVDQRRTNLTRFPLFFPEKRTFFLEGSDVFEFGLGLGTDLLPFFSRRIGLLGGAQVPVRVGGKLTGQRGSTRIGVIAARTGDIAAADGTGLAVVRVRQNVLRESSVGAIVTAGDPLGGAGWLGGVDAVYRTSRFRGDKNFLVGASALWADRDGATGDRTALAVKVDYPNDLIDAAVTYRRIGDGFDPPLGFVPRRAVQLLTAGADISPRPGRWGIRRMFFENRFTLATDLAGQWESYRYFFAPVNWEFTTGDRIEVNANPQGERLAEPFEVSDGVRIDPGTYRFVRYRLEVETSPTRRLNGQATWWFGRFYDGTLDQYQLEAGWRPSATLGLQVELDHNVGRLPAGDFEATVVSGQLRYNPSADLQFSTLVQYDNESRSIGSNTRLRWTITPATELFVVYNHNVRDRLDRWAFDSNQLLAKLRVAFRR
ncbi:MAG: DUF5916 domain-containing protein [Gemmatimonadales bacterium]